MQDTGAAMLHPFVFELLEQLKGRPAISDGTPEQAREVLSQSRALFGVGPEMSKVHDFDLPTRQGDISARLLVPNDEPKGIIVYLHGGGWVVGSIDDFEVLCRTLAAASGCAVLMPEYRLAPEYAFPVPLQDAEDAVRWCADNVEMLIGRVVPIVLAGDSAGGNLATVVATQLKGDVQIALQALIYPVTDCDFDTRSYQAYGEGLPVLTRDMKWFFDLYASREDWPSPAISPRRSQDLAGVPSAVVVIAECDVLAEEGMAYAKRLTEFGVPVTCRTVRGFPHGFIRWHNLVDVVADEVLVLAHDISGAWQQWEAIAARS